MKGVNRFVAIVGAVGACAVAAASCGIEKQGAPGLAGPSEFGTSVVLSAAPDVVNRDGASQSIVTILARDANAAPIANLPLNLSLSPINGGSLSASQVVTDGAGRATFAFVAPPADLAINAVIIGATPVGSNFQSAVTRTVAVALVGPAAATPSFTVTPPGPLRFEAVTLDASATTYNNTPCGALCTYAWTIGSEATLTGQIVTYHFQRQQTYQVTLEVTAPTGLKTPLSRTVVVAAGTPPTASFTISPTNPKVNDTVWVNASSSTAANGATIAEYTWDFGGGQAAASGVTASTTYTAARTYVIRLTVRDSNGLTATTTRELTVAQ